MLFFDSSAAIELLRGNTKLDEILDDDQIVLSVLSVYELLWAAERKGDNVNQKVQRFIESCRIVPVTYEIARLAALTKIKLMKSGKDKPAIDVLIAAAAEDEGLRFITFDKDFEDIAKSSNLDLLWIKSENGAK